MLNWIFTSFIGRILITAVVSMVPIIELRGGIPIGYCGIAGMFSGIGYWAIIAALIGNLIPIPFVLLFMDKILAWVRTWGNFFGKLVDKLETRVERKSASVKKYEKLGLLLFVGIPLPGTGAWTGALIASFLGIKFKDALISIVLGVLLAALIVTIVTLCGVDIFVNLA